LLDLISFAHIDCLILYTILFLLWRYVGVGSLVYLVASRLFFTGFAGHPLLSYWITVHQSHRASTTRCQPTTSLYDPFVALLTSNECYHVEHHDFPTVPARHLPRLKALAPEFYDTLPHYESWWKTIAHYFSHRDEYVYACQT
jgi:sphingolipid delta-4 desaturase